MSMCDYMSSYVRSSIQQHSTRQHKQLHRHANHILHSLMNVLQIHIDGHSDMAVPRYDPRMPFFHWPNTKDQLYHLMQKCDAFIQVGNVSYECLVAGTWWLDTNMQQTNTYYTRAYRLTLKLSRCSTELLNC